MFPNRTGRICLIVAAMHLSALCVSSVHAQQATNPSTGSTAESESYSEFLTLLREERNKTSTSGGANRPGGKDFGGSINSTPYQQAITDVTADELTFVQVTPSQQATPSQQTTPGQEATGDEDQTDDASIASGTPDFETASDQPEADPLKLADVIASLYRSYPEIIAARQQPAVAGGELISAYGAYDTKLGAYSLSEALGFYENYRSGLGVARQTWWGGYVSAGYRIGRGSFQPWYRERETNRGGELKVGIIQPLLQGRAIDAQRVAVFQASLAQQAAEPVIQQAILESSREATSLYWQWVAAGAVLEAQRELLSLAEKRNEQFQAGVKAGKFAEIDLILNQQLMAERRAKRIETEQKFRAISFKLAVYLRNESGQPMIPSDEWLPTYFPKITQPPTNDFHDDLASALSRRPEPQILQFELRKIQLERRLACNELMPRFDLVAEASQDVGESLKVPDDKGDFQVVLGFQSEVPIQRRKARGKLQSTAAKSAQIDEKIRLMQNKIAAELQTANNALLLSSQVVDQTETALRAAIETLERYRFAFSKGKIDLIYLNLLETKANETEIKLVEAQRDWFAALSSMQIALGLDPLDQAMNISLLPPSDMPGPGRLPQPGIDSQEQLQRDWELHSKQP